MTLCTLCGNESGAENRVCRRCKEKLEQPPRLALIAHIREQIRAGTYETEGKLEIVAERLAERLRKEGA